MNEQLPGISHIMFSPETISSHVHKKGGGGKGLSDKAKPSTDHSWYAGMGVRMQISYLSGNYAIF